MTDEFPARVPAHGMNTHHASSFPLTLLLAVALAAAPLLSAFAAPVPMDHGADLAGVQVHVHPDGVSEQRSGPVCLNNFPRFTE